MRSSDPSGQGKLLLTSWRKSKGATCYLLMSGQLQSKGDRPKREVVKRGQTKIEKTRLGYEDRGISGPWIGIKVEWKYMNA